MRGALFFLTVALSAITLLSPGSTFSNNNGMATMLADARNRNQERWYSVTDETTQKIYYWNKQNGETTWTKPKGVRITPGVKWHHKRKNASPPPSSKKNKGSKGAKAAKKNNDKAPKVELKESEEFEVLDEEGDLIPPPPPAISYVLVAVGVAALALVAVVLVVNSRRDAKMVNDIYKSQ